VFGSPLEIFLPQEQERVYIRVFYSTTKAGKASQWLEPSQTAGKHHPYYFSQCQAIHARSLLPCQDTPYLKIQYSASIECPNPLRALMSANRTGEKANEENNSKIYMFSQPIKIPTYLIALAIGNIQGIDVSPRTTVFAEPEIVKAAAKEFEDIEMIMKAGEAIVMPYMWGRYDLLVLPPSLYVHFSLYFIYMFAYSRN
jgi:leukotriene-A4 hydrolase